jgi:acetone carboxylase gamma subunit
VLRVLEYLAVDDKERVFRCLKCGNILGPATGDYKDYALKRTVPNSKAQPEFLASYAAKKNNFVMREYYCPHCAVMFEVDVVHKDEPQIRSIELKL